ncbi:MAG: cytochrome d ubiquinol oxidase subunit II, partial [Fibrobacteres bacterium]|nr:cytochrome d ubiquinol oxidase subunit II [Fibrobacterota bacterium]
MENFFWADYAFFLMIFFFMMYAVLDGFDLGIGTLVLFTKDKQRKDRLIRHIAPFWDGNEVWLVIAAALLFAAFPTIFGYILSSFYLPIMITVFAFIIRAVTLEFSYHDQKNQTLWLTIFGLASSAIAFLGLLVLGFLIYGLPMTSAGVVSRNLNDYIVAFPYVFAFIGVLLTTLHGYAYAKHGGIWSMADGLAEKKSSMLFVITSILICGVWIFAGIDGYPIIIKCSNNPEWGILIHSVSSPVTTLKPLVIFGSIMTFLIL